MISEHVPLLLCKRLFTKTLAGESQLDKPETMVFWKMLVSQADKHQLSSPQRSKHPVHENT